ncbi:MAG TPA: spore coat U domain-containing protein [Cellvibrio sp.]|nr:spore coat U domain-containing protein [Cellvibrio sp.]
MKHRLTVANLFFLSVSILLIVPLSQAATVNGTLGITAIVGSGCQVNNSNVTAGVVDFGSLDFGSINTIGAQNIDAQTTGNGSGSIVMECSGGTSFSIAIDNGQHFGSGSRSMANAGNASILLSYTLYQNAARTIPWTNASPLATTASGAADTFHVYGRIPGGQSGITSGTYNDTVQVVINW